MPGDPSPPPSPPPVFYSSGGSSATTKLLIVVLIIAFAILASISFHLVRHYLSRRRTSSIPPLSLPRPPSSHTEQPTSTSAAAAAAAASPPPPSYKNQPISSFPLVSLSSPSDLNPKSPDCAVCLSPFRPRDDLRLLPTCRHAFHLHCIDMWLQSTPSCPLCRSPAVPEEKPGPSNSFQVEIDLSYSFGSSVEHLVGEEVEASVDRRDSVKEENGERGDEEEEGGGRGWLREYLDRVASSASSSFNSLTFSGRLSSHRYDSGPIESVAAGDGRSWDAEGAEWVEESGLAGIYRWFVGI